MKKILLAMLLTSCLSASEDPASRNNDDLKHRIYVCMLYEESSYENNSSLDPFSALQKQLSETHSLTNEDLASEIKNHSNYSFRKEDGTMRYKIKRLKVILKLPEELFVDTTTVSEDSNLKE